MSGFLVSAAYFGLQVSGAETAPRVEVFYHAILLVPGFQCAFQVPGFWCMLRVSGFCFRFGVPGFGYRFRDMRLPAKENSNSHGARPVS